MTNTELIPVPHYRNLVLSLLSVTEKMSVPVADALSLALAESITSTVDLPPFANSSMDGYAVHVQDVHPGARLPVVADLPAGSTQQFELAPGSAARIMTGAPIPHGAQAVVPVEATDGGLREVEFRAVVEPDAFIRPAGDDLPVGSVLATTGQELTPPRLALLASAGISRCVVHRRPRVAVFSTGDELVEAGEPLSRGKIYDSNATLVSALLRRELVDVEVVESLGDDPTRASQRLLQVAPHVDLIVTMGGISAGAYEPIKQAFGEDSGVSFHSVAMQPGKPQGLGLVGSTPLIALPGNPLSSLVTFEVIVKPALRRLGGFRDIEQPRAALILVGEQVRRPDRTRYLPGVADFVSGEVTAANRQGSHRSSTAIGMNCLIEVEPGEGVVSSGDQVSVILTG